MKILNEDLSLIHKITVEKNKRKAIEASGKRNEEPNLLNTSKALDHYYFLNKMRLYCAFLSIKNIINLEKIDYTAKDFLLIEEIIAAIESKKINHPTINIYNQLRRLLEAIEISSPKMDLLFQSTQKMVEKKQKELAKEEVLEIYSLLNNYCIRRMNEGKEKYKAIFIETNSQLINLNYTNITDDEIIMRPSLFKNIATVAASLKKTDLFKNLRTYGLPNLEMKNTTQLHFEWTEKFIAFYGTKLGDSKQAKVYNLYCSVFLEFQRKDFQKAYQLFQNPMRIQGAFLNLNIKTLHLKILYEVIQENPATLERDKIEVAKVLDAYRNLLKYESSKKQELSYQIFYFQQFDLLFKKLFALFYKYAGRLDNAKSRPFQKKKKDLLILIQKKKYSYSDWFLEKLEQLN